MNYEEMLLFVKRYLETRKAIRSKNANFSFRNRFEHIQRVYRWCLRLLEECPNCDREMVLTAAIFHDVGYAHNAENHASESAEIFIQYAQQQEMDYEFTLRTAEIIALHSDKTLLQQSSTPLELILLLEADLLDEEGALGIAWDLMGEGAGYPDCFERALRAVEGHSGHILHQEYMVTPLAKKYWKEKQELVRGFLHALSEDLFLD